ncbi:MAG: hypothetical protein ACRDRZ_13010 [Pseudonocardiaceae bacterium]
MSQDPPPAAVVEINARLHGVNHSAPSNSKYNPLAEYLAGLTGLDLASIYIVHISKPGNVTVRMEQSQRAKHAELLIGVVSNPDHIEAARSAVRGVARKLSDHAPSFVPCHRRGTDQSPAIVG